MTFLSLLRSKKCLKLSYYPGDGEFILWSIVAYRLVLSLVCLLLMLDDFIFRYLFADIVVIVYDYYFLLDNSWTVSLLAVYSASFRFFLIKT